ncbi:MAG: DNA-directed RNA polymerase subunit beta [Candidatus Enteromonas sp.]|jgi:DNA-directed RNA polymerase subunit beta|nr:DNA-directed RNA polymerase subunit beta [Bacilli bacterium]MBQ4182619.1 DNA-directed RNA polymerase subunit beta [Bacilli bacterium]MEE3426588.1 DNA-directed RNA polymerase subunit beta [Candidatus Enteromonas sp.]MEE3431707.1 DNA-directed RNA polymerase subunit beta [Candidatus Enteromonas sp.]
MAKEEKFNTTYKDYKAGVNGRLNFNKISGDTPLPYLVEIQTDSYKWFLEKGINEVLAEVFPIENYAGTAAIDYVSCRLEAPQWDPLECKAADLTYSSKLKVTLRLQSKATGEIKEAEVFMGELPLMTESGTFIVNGAERVIVSQIVRSPGAYFQDTADKSGTHIYNGEIIPTRGTWLQFESDLKNVLWVRIDRQRKMPAVILFKALGLASEKTLTELFGESEAMLNTLKKDENIKSEQAALADIFVKLKPGEPITPEGIVTFLKQKFFDDKRYDLGRAGRFKYSAKLGIYDRLEGRILAENLVSADGEIFSYTKGDEERFLVKGTKLHKNDVQALRDAEFFEKGAHTKTLKTDDALDDHSNVNVVKVYAHDKETDKVVNIIGTDLNLTIARVTVSDMVACFSYFCNIMDGIGQTDDIDHLGNRRVRCVGELLQTQFRIGLTKMAKNVQQKMSISDMESVTPQSLINIRPLTSSIREFFASSQLSQFMDQTNPLAELTNKRRISALGPGGLTRDRASMEVRDVHYTHYGRICPIETPEGQNIGLINNLSTYARINNYGFIETPYRIVINDKDANGVEHFYVSDKAEYLSADKERGRYVAGANIRLGEPVMVNGEMVREILDDEVTARHDEDNILAPKHLIEYVDVSPKQIVSIAAACIPFLENDDSTRALMGANMQRQALPLLRPSIPYVGTGMEGVIAKDSGLAVVAVADGKVTYMDSSTIVIKEGKESRTYKLQKFDRSNNGTCINQKPIVKVGDDVKAGSVIADGPAMRNGELALGQNILVAYMTWNGYNYEDAIVMSERMVKEDTFTTIHIERYELECRDTKLGAEEITRDVPNVSDEAKTFLDERGIIVEGAEVKEGDILVGKVTPKGQTEPTPEEKLLMAIFAEKTKEGKDTSLRVPHGGAGIIHKVRVFSRKNKDPLPPGVNEIVRVYIVQKRKISEGDKMSGRHGNKGVISRILPVQDMPFLADGTPIDIMLSPMGVPSRMNIGQILEVHLGLACSKLKMRVATPPFDGVSNDEIVDLMKKAGISDDGKTVLYDGRTGERFNERISVGIQYMIKLVHMVDDKIHARATGPYSLVTQQPLGGKAQNGGQRFGEMEVWALEGYGAAHVLQEMLTIKSDDRVGRRKTYEAIIKGYEIPRPGMPEAFKVFTKELRGLGMRVNLYNKEGETIDMDALAKEALVEERKVNSAIRNLTNPKDEEPSPVDTVEVSSEQVAEEGLSVSSRMPGDAE